jgi:hypothetical protein
MDSAEIFNIDQKLNSTPILKNVCHLLSAEDTKHELFTRDKFEVFQEWCDKEGVIMPKL